MLRPVLFRVSLGAWAIRALVLSRSELWFENLALRQQVCALKRERPRPPLDNVDRAFWVALRAFWLGWASRLISVDPDTVANRNRERIRRYWATLSQRNRRPGRPRIDPKIPRRIRLMAQATTKGPSRDAHLYFPVIWNKDEYRAPGLEHFIVSRNA
jgi:hypothetical protein